MPAKAKPMQPIVALKALKTLINDPEQTEQVFVIIRAMSGNHLEKSYARFRQTISGVRILREERQLLDVLQNREFLLSLPADSLGRHYLHFVETEQITADGLVEASQNDEQMIDDPGLLLFSERLRDMHDLWHVVTGYGRDTFGEACLLAFTYAQTRNRGVGIIALVGMEKIAREIGPDVRPAMWQGYKAGKAASWLPAADWEHLLTQPIEAVRTELSIRPPVKYRQIFDQQPIANAA